MVLRVCRVWHNMFYMWHGKYSNVWHDIRLVGFLKLQVSFAKESYKRDYILQKRPIILHGKYSHVRHDTFTCVTWHVHMCDMTHSHVWHTVLRRYRWPTSTGWRRLKGSPKSQIIFHKRATKYRALLRKMTYKDKGSYESSPPCKRVCESSMLFWLNKTKKTKYDKITYSKILQNKSEMNQITIHWRRDHWCMCDSWYLVRVCLLLLWEREWGKAESP